MTDGDDAKGTCVSRRLCETIKTLTEQRLAFDSRMGERASASDAKPLPLNRNRHGDQISQRKAGEATHNANESSQELRLTQQSAGLLMSTEARVTYMKLRGDQLLHLAEMARHDGGFSTPQCEGLAAEALEAYLSAQHEASSKISDSTTATNVVNSSSSSGNGSTLPALHPLQVELALRISSVLLHLLDRPVEAWEVGYSTYLAAAEHPIRLGARGLAITQALRDHLARIDTQPGGGWHQRNREQVDNRRDSSSAKAYGQRTGRATGEYGHGERLVEGEWGFLRMAAECDEAGGHRVGYGGVRNDKLWHLAQVKQVRACMDAITSTDRVLLGTMEHADVVQAALKQVSYMGGLSFFDLSIHFNRKMKRVPKTYGSRAVSFVNFRSQDNEDDLDRICAGRVVGDFEPRWHDNATVMFVSCTGMAHSKNHSYCCSVPKDSTDDRACEYGC